MKFIKELNDKVYNKKTDKCDNLYNDIMNAIEEAYNQGKRSVIITLSGDDCDGDIFSWIYFTLKNEGYNISDVHGPLLHKKLTVRW